MLLLSRKSGEAVRIGDQIVVKVVQCSRGGVKLLFDVPREIPVMREELLEAPQADRTRDRFDSRDEEDTGFSMSFLGA